MSLLVVGGLGAILSIFLELYIPQGHTSTQVVWLGTFPSLFVGVGKFNLDSLPEICNKLQQSHGLFKGNYLLLPLGLVYGRRPATIISIIILLGSTIGCALSQTFEQHLGLRILQGLATGATESVCSVEIQVLQIGQPALTITWFSCFLSCYPRSRLCINAE